MDALEVIGYLRQVPLFSRTSDAFLGRVAAITQIETFPRGSRLAVVGRAGRALYYVLSGEALVSAARAKGRLRPVGYVRAGDSFGVTSLLLGEPHDTTIEAKTDLTALVLYRTDFDRLLRELPDLADQLFLPDEITAKLGHERLSWLEPGEVVVFHGQRHWFVFARAILLPTLGLIALSTFGYALLRLLELDCWAVPLAMLLVLYGLVVLWNVIDWHNDYFVVTTQRVVRRELVLYQYESRHEAPLNRVQDVNIKRDFWGNLIGFGSVVVETAAQSGIGRIVFDHLPNPEQAKDAILQQVVRMQARVRVTERETLRAELKRRLQWATAEELAAQGQSRVTPEAVAPSKPQRAGRGLGGLRILPPLRLEEGGRITWRKHWYFLLRRLVKPVLAALALIGLFVAYLAGVLPLLPPANPGVVAIALVLGCAIGFWLWWQMVDWENDIYVITEDRLIDIEKKPLFFAEDRRETTLDRVQNVNLTIPSPLAAALNFGNVDIDTAGGEGKFTFTNVVAPHEVQREIMSRVSRLRDRRQQLESQQRRSEIGEWFAAYESLRGERPEAQAEGPQKEEPPAQP